MSSRGRVGASAIVRTALRDRAVQRASARPWFSDALGTTTEQRAMNNYAGHRLSPWLGHIMVSRQETARPLLTPGEVMQLPPDDELVLVSGIAPIRARKARYYEDRQLTRRILAPPALLLPRAGGAGGRPVLRANDWTPLGEPPDTATEDESAATSLVGRDRANGGIRLDPAVQSHEAIVPEPKHDADIGGFTDDPDDATIVPKDVDRQLRASCPSFRSAAER